MSYWREFDYWHGRDEGLNKPQVVKPKQVPPDGVPCSHPGCLRHISHPCEGCGRIGGRSPKTKRA